MRRFWARGRLRTEDPVEPGHELRVADHLAEGPRPLLLQRLPAPHPLLVQLAQQLLRRPSRFAVLWHARGLAGVAAAELGVVEALDAMGQLAERFAVSRRDSHHLADDLDRKSARDVDREVAFPPLEHVPQGPLEGATGEVFERENLAWLHRAADESAEPSVSRGIHLEHGRLPSARLEGLVVDHDPVALVRERLRVAAYPEHVVVSRQRPEARAARLWVPMDGILGAQTAKKLVRGSPSEEADIAQVDLSSGLRHLVPRHRRSIGS